VALVIELGGMVYPQQIGVWHPNRLQRAIITISVLGVAVSAGRELWGLAIMITTLGASVVWVIDRSGR
jgi:hypothetical protein